MIVAQHTRTGKTEKFSAEHWRKMIDRGDSRNWKIIEQTVEAPPEIRAAVEAMKKGRKKSVETVEEERPSAGDDEENE